MFLPAPTTLRGSSRLTWLLTERIWDRSFWMRTLRSAISLRLLWRLFPNSAEQAARSSSWRAKRGWWARTAHCVPFPPFCPPPPEYPVSHSLLLFFRSPQPPPLQPSRQPASRLLSPVLPHHASYSCPRLSCTHCAHTWPSTAGWHSTLSFWGEQTVGSPGPHRPLGPSTTRSYQFSPPACELTAVAAAPVLLLHPQDLRHA